MKAFFSFGVAVLIATLAWADTQKEGGIIGTGVVGEITGVEQFEVSGMQFNLPENLLLIGLDDVQELEIGMTVILNAARDGDGWQATELQRTPVLVGPVTGAGEVMGVPVTGNVPENGHVVVDGYWSSTGVVATRITRSTAGNVSVRGRYDSAGLIGRVQLQTPIPDAGTNEITTAFGTFQDGKLRVSRHVSGLFDTREPELVLAEGFFEPRADSSNGVAFSVDVNASDLADLDTSRKHRFCVLRGRLDFDPDRLPESEAEAVRDFCISAER